MDLNVIYEDNHLIVVEKPAGILSQADNTNDIDMLTLIKNYLKIKYQKPGNVFVGLVHRLDRMTSGVMVFAKTSKAASRLSEQIRNRKLTKKYYAIIKGIVPISGEFKDYLFKDENIKKSIISDEENGKFAHLKFDRIAINNNCSLVDVELLTGRYHQIRAQFGYRKFPLIGDCLYGYEGIHPLMLHSYYISFYHPISKEFVEFCIYPNTKAWLNYFSLDILQK